MRVTLAAALACLLATGAYPVEQKKKSGKKTAAKSAATSTAAKTATTRTKRGSTKKSATRKTGAAKTSSSKTASTSKASSKKGKSTRSAQSWRSRQAAPTPDRYKQIQEALAAKGYLNGEPSGVWNGQSTEALRRFQSDQNLEPSGKLNSLSLIALGLGPKRDNAPVPPPPPR